MAQWMRKPSERQRATVPTIARAAVRGCPCPVAGRSLRRPIRRDGSVPAGLRSLDADCAPASCLRLSATPALGTWAAPHGFRPRYMKPSDAEEPVGGTRRSPVNSATHERCKIRPRASRSRIRRRRACRSRRTNAGDDGQPSPKVASPLRRLRRGLAGLPFSLATASCPPAHWIVIGRLNTFSKRSVRRSAPQMSTSGS